MEHTQEGRTVFLNSLTVGISGSANLRAGENNFGRGLHLKSKETVM